MTARREDAGLLNLLIVDSSEADAALVAHELRSHGHAVRYTRVETEAAYRAALQRESWDGVLTEYNLNGFGAIRALEILRDDGLDLPFLLVSGAIGEESAVDAMRAGVQDFIAKCRLARLAPALEREIRDAAIRREHARTRAQREADDRRFRLLVEDAPSAITLVTPDGRIGYNSPALSRLFGYEPGELTGKDALEFVHPEDVERVRDILAHLIGSPGSTAVAEYRCRRKDGRWIVLHSTARNHLRDAGVGAIVINSHDVTDQKAAELALGQRERELETLTRNAPDMIVRLDADLRHLFVNDTVCRVMGIPKSRFLGVRPREMDLEPRLTERWEAILRAVLTTGREATQIFTFATRAGTRTFQTRMVPEFDDEGVARTVIAFSRDITDLKAAERAVHESEARFRALIEGATDLIYVVDADGVISYVSPSIERVLGYRAAERIGASIFDLIHEDDVEGAKAALWAGISEQDGRGAGQIRVRHADGGWRVLEAVGRNLLESPAVRGIVIHARDVTERQELEDQLRHAQKMEAVGRLAGGVAHDFNNLLTVIRGNAQLALADLPDPHPARIELEEIGHAAERASALTSQLLAFSRRQILEPREIDISVLLGDMRRMLLRLVTEDIELRSELEASNAPVLADPGQIEQVVMNLVVNARDAMPDGGKLTIATDVVEIGPAGLRAGAERLEPGRYVRLRVRDTGHGMDDALQARIFDPFFTTKEKSKGTGLGLSTVYGIVKQSGGAILVRSAPGRGAEFSVYLPEADPVLPTPEPHVAEPVSHLHSGVPRTVLLVEDDENVRSLLCKVLRRWKYCVMEASNGREAVEIARCHDGPIDLLMTDVVMPVFGGAEAARRIREDRPGMRVLFMSGHNDEALERQGLRNGEIALIAKPLTPVALAHKLSEIWNGNGGTTYVSP
jgi:two-component system, cell cycle sensor histidine kinase and response regulator CckA